MRWVGIEIKDKTLVSPSNQTQFLIFLPPPPPSPASELYGSSSLNSRVSPSVLLIIVILAVIFFISGLVHLLIRLLLKPPNREPDDSDNVTALQGQLQQLFHLHDFGVDQSFIDALPIFNYKSIIGLKDPFDCAVCLCEFEADDKLRLLPKCSHAFHMDCIDTWLLSHSTCPLCRASLLTDFSQSTNFSPVVLLLESGINGESSREIVSDREQGLPGTNSTARVSSRLRSRPESFRSNDIQAKIGDTHGEILSSGDTVLQVKLGKLKNVDGRRGECSNENPSPDARRCFSMGYFAYVMDENSSLQVPIGTPPLNKRQPSTSKKPCLPLTSRHRHVLSESGGGELSVIDGFKIVEFHDSKPIDKESFSISKIWVRGKKETASDPCRRAVSLRFPEQIYSSAGDEKNNRRTTSEIHMSRWANESRYQEETHSDFSSDQPNPPSFARRTLLWFMDRKPNRNVRSLFQ